MKVLLSLAATNESLYFNSGLLVLWYGLNSVLQYTLHITLSSYSKYTTLKTATLFTSFLDHQVVLKPIQDFRHIPIGNKFILEKVSPMMCCGCKVTLFYAKNTRQILEKEEEWIKKSKNSNIFFNMQWVLKTAT